MSSPLSKQNEAVKFAAISADSMRNLKLLGWLLVIGNLVALLLLLLLESGFADAALKYSFFTLMYIISLICAMFALKDSSNIMLYPMLVTTVTFVVILLSAWIFVLFNKFFCSHSSNLYLLLTQYGIVFSQCKMYRNILPLRATFLSVIALEKSFEFVIFRRLMKFFDLQQCSNAHFCVAEINKAFSTRNDTDDEVIVYEKIRKGSPNGHTNYDIKAIP
ncbi:unnamed protein product [Litomosoides sigmodontis]|uniref:Uncharacterized protein n=1 Tax=Litomosoides sigmodontis TaxID=42156 RepID=A0A3P6UDQ1_LITSI|nr:unnamed protein product [Litomosoides sigmodontis]